MLSLETYGHEDDWQYIDNVLDAKFVFGKDRELSGFAREVIENVKVLVTRPDSKLVVVGSGSVSASDRIITVFAATLVQDTNPVDLQEGDILFVGSGVAELKYLVASVFNSNSECQFSCYVKQLPHVGVA